MYFFFLCTRSKTILVFGVAGEKRQFGRNNLLSHLIVFGKRRLEDIFFDAVLNAESIYYHFFLFVYLFFSFVCLKPLTVFRNTNIFDTFGRAPNFAQRKINSKSRLNYILFFFRRRRIIRRNFHIIKTVTVKCTLDLTDARSTFNLIMRVHITLHLYIVKKERKGEKEESMKDALI